MRVFFNDFIKIHQSRREKYHQALDAVLDKGWLILGDHVRAFEQSFSKEIAVDHCVGVANGLEALQISLLALGIKQNDEVITTPLSAMATTLSIMSVGAVPVFVDVDDKGLIDTSLIEAKITEKTTAIMPVHLYGNTVNMTAIMKLAKKFKLLVIEDAAQAHGSSWNGQRAGSMGDVGCFSFYPTKNVGALGDGGALTTNLTTVAKDCAIIRDYGQSQKYIHVRYGLNSRLDELQAAFLLETLKYLDSENEARAVIANYYQQELKSIPEISVITPYTNQVGNWHLFIIKTQKRDDLQKFLADNEVQTLVHYPLTLPDQPLFQGKYANLEIPQARELVSQVLSLPCNPVLTHPDIEYVVQTIKHFFS